MESCVAPFSFGYVMAVFETFSKRQAKLRGDVPDVYSYDVIEFPLRVQLFQIIEEGIGGWYTDAGNRNIPAQNAYARIVATLRREYGTFHLGTMRLKAATGNVLDELKDHILWAPTEHVLDAVELCCMLIDDLLDDGPQRTLAGRSAKAALDEINLRFREHGLGYEFSSGQIIRIDSELVHAEAVKPALSLIADKAYAGAQEEFLNAYDHYRKGNHKEAVTEAAKAFESVMKTILSKRGWTHSPTDPAAKLIAALYDGGLLPPFWQNYTTGLRMMLEGIPTPRNKNAAHGQGSVPTEMPSHLAGYILHMTASTIVFLVKAEQALP